MGETTNVHGSDHHPAPGEHETRKPEEGPTAHEFDAGRRVHDGGARPGSNYRFRRATPQFRDPRQTAFVIATGPSAAAVATLRLPDWPAIAVNDAWRLKPDACALYAADRRWLAYHRDSIRKEFAGAVYTADAVTAKEQGYIHCTVEHREGLSLTPDVLYAGGPMGNSGAQAINLAVQLGARQLVLVGFDMQGSHFFGEHPQEVNRVHDSPFEAFVRGMGGMAAELDRLGIGVVNASPKSKLPYWDKIELQELCSARL